MNEDKKICPLFMSQMISRSVEYGIDLIIDSNFEEGFAQLIECSEEECGWWNESRQACGMRGIGKSF